MAIDPEDLREALDLSTWTEREGTVCVRGVMCPICTREHKPAPGVTSGRLKCRPCGRWLQFAKVKTPLGPGWLSILAPGQREYDSPDGPAARN